MAHGIPASRHPDHKASQRRIAELHHDIERLKGEVMDALFAATEAAKAEGKDIEALQADQRAVMDDPKYDTKPLYDEARQLGQRVASTNLYRYDGGTLVIRYDKVGKAAWRAEFERLGQPLPEELTRRPQFTRR